MSTRSVKLHNIASQIKEKATFAISLRVICSVALCAALLVAVIASWHWPLVGDAALMRYVVFLIHHGAVPYKDIIDVNLPGTYAAEDMAMTIFGAGRSGLRLYDFSLMAAIISGCIIFTGSRRWFGGIFAGCVFSIIHLQDGFGQAGQRDLLMAALLIWALIVLLRAEQGRYLFLWGTLYGICAGAMLTIKPVLLPLDAVLLVVAAWQLHRDHRKVGHFVTASVVGFSIPCLSMLLWLRVSGGWSAFWTNTLPLIKFHASLGRHTTPYLLSHAISPIEALIVLWLLLEVIEHRKFGVERIFLVIGIFGTIVAYVLQAKGDPYQRYPLLVVVLIAIGLALDHGIRSKHPVRFLAASICLIASFWLCPQMARRVTSFSTVTPLQNALTSQLAELNRKVTLAGNVQCLDTTGGCISVLYGMHLPESTGYLYDCYLFTPASPETDRYRTMFWSAYKVAAPKVLVITSQFCFGDPRGFGKLSMWPTLNEDIKSNYVEYSDWHTTIQEHWWSRRDNPFQFRIYVRKAFLPNKAPNKE